MKYGVTAYDADKIKTGYLTSENSLRAKLYYAVDAAAFEKAYIKLLAQCTGNNNIKGGGSFQRNKNINQTKIMEESFMLKSKKSVACF